MAREACPVVVSETTIWIIMMTKFLTPFVIVFAGTFLSCKADDSPRKLPEMIVQSKRLSKRGQYPKLRSLMDSSLVTSLKITEHQYQTVNQAIRGLAGITLVQGGNEGQLSSLFIRGTESRHSQVRRDGMKLIGTDVLTGGFNFAHLKTTNIESIDVIRGPVTSLYGADAPGGVILLTTPIGNGVPSEHFSLEGGSYRFYKARGVLQGEQKDTNFYVNLTQYGSGGYKQQPKEFRLPGGVYSSLPSEQFSGTFRLGQQFGQSTFLSWINELSKNSLKTQRDFKVTPMRENKIFNRVLVQNILPQFESTVGVGYNQVESNADYYEPSFFKSTLSRFQVDSRQTWKVSPSHHLTVSGEYGLENLRMSYPNASMSGDFKGHMQQVGGGLFYRWLRESTVLEASGRLDALSQNKAYPTYRASGRYEFLKDTWIGVSYGTAIKEPTITQRYFRSVYVIPNPSLQSEEIQSYEFNLRRYWTPDLQTEIIYFHNRLKNLIEYVYSKKTNLNTGKAETKGVEVIAKYQPLSTLMFEGNYTYTHAQNKDTHQWLLRRPFNKWSLLMTYRHEGYTICFDYTYVGRRPDIDPFTFSRVTAKGYSELGVKGNYQYSENAKLYTRFENCLNNHRQNPVGVRKAGFQIVGGVEITL